MGRPLKRAHLRLPWYNPFPMNPFSECWRPRLFACLAAAILLFPPALRAATPAEVGSYAPRLELADLDGTARNVVWGEGAPAATIVFFFDPLAPGCLLEMGFLDALSNRGRDFGLAVYAVEAKGRQPAAAWRSGVDGRN